MAPKKKKQTTRVRYTAVHKFSAGLSLLAFLVVIIAGVMAEARVITITYRAAAVIIIIGLATRILIKTWASYEETKRG